MFKTPAGHLLPASGEFLGQEVSFWFRSLPGKAENKHQSPARFLDDLIQVFMESLVRSALPSLTGTLLTFLAGILGSVVLCWGEGFSLWSLLKRW